MFEKFAAGGAGRGEENGEKGIAEDAKCTNA